MKHFNFFQINWGTDLKKTFLDVLFKKPQYIFEMLFMPQKQTQVKPV